MLLSSGKQTCRKAVNSQHSACPAVPSVFTFPGERTHTARSHRCTAVQVGAPQCMLFRGLQVPVPVIIWHREVSKLYRLCSLRRSFSAIQSYLHSSPHRSHSSARSVFCLSDCRRAVSPIFMPARIMRHPSSVMNLTGTVFFSLLIFWAQRGPSECHAPR